MEDISNITDVVIIEDAVRKDEFAFKCMLYKLCVFANDSNKGIEIIRSYFESELGRESNNFTIRSNFEKPTKWINTTNKEKLYPRLYNDCMFYIDSHDSISTIGSEYSRRMSDNRKKAMKRCLQSFMDEYKKEVKKETKKAERTDAIDKNFIKNSVTNKLRDKQIDALIDTAKDSRYINTICVMIFRSEVFTYDSMPFCEWVEKFYKAMCKEAPKTKKPSQIKLNPNVVKSFERILPQSNKKINKYKRTKKS